MPTVSTYLDRAETEKLKRFCERRNMKRYRAIRMLILKGMIGIEQGLIRDEEGIAGTSGNLGDEAERNREQDWGKLFKLDAGKRQSKRGDK